MSEHAPRDGDLADAVIECVRTGRVSSRRDVIDVLGIAPATASVLVKRLLHDGILIERGQGPSTGGRRPKLLGLGDQRGVSACAELGGRHARLGIVNPSGTLLAASEIPLEIASGPACVFDALQAGWDSLMSDGHEIRGVAVAFPGPVDVEQGIVVSPARMPGWAGVNPRDELARRFGVPAFIENDARAGAVGEARTRRDSLDAFAYVKAGTGIGGAWIVGGELYRGPHGLAGEITHNQLPGIDLHPGCGCGNRGCLELVASGAALRHQLAERGIDIAGTKALVDLARDSNPEVSTLVRAAGLHLGEVLAPLVNFLNPGGVIVGGALSGSDAFVAAVRGVLYDRCLPMCTQGLVIEASAAGADAALIGLGDLASRARTGVIRSEERPHR